MSQDINSHGHSFWINPLFTNINNWGVFLDRDGVIIEDVHLLHNIKEYHIFPQAIKAIKRLNQHQIPVIIATNQTVVARGLTDEIFINQTHDRIMNDLAKENTWIDGIAVCLHSPQADIEKYRLSCKWRKPEPGMFLDTAQQLGFTPSKCWGIGDKARDILAYQNAGMSDILVLTGHGGDDSQYQAKPSVIKPDLLEAVEYIINNLEI